MVDNFKRWSKQPDISQLLPRLDNWFAGTRGQDLLAAQQVIIDDLLSSCFGYHLLQLSVGSSLRLFDESRVQKKFRAHPYGLEHEVLSDFDQLPFESESIDVVVLHHVQEFVANPHELLREIQRVIIPGGHLIIVGFNPWSLAGIAGQIGRWLPGSIWHNHLISCGRITDWLSLLGFESEKHFYGYHMPRILERTNKPMINRLLKSWPFGHFYAVGAIKQVATLTPSKPIWRRPVNNFGHLSPVKRTGSQQCVNQRQTK